jgi:rubrerythrin
MSEDKSLNILKQAILLEKRGRSFYRTAAGQADSPAIKTFFNTMAEEEVRHIQILSDQFKAYQQSGKFMTSDTGETGMQGVADGVLTSELRGRISAADFEAAAISAAMAMEERAVKLYASRAKSADDPEEKALYRWLADWETTHLEVLSELDRTLTEQIWNDNSFWPF